jgi:hypothetical protein
MLTHEAWGDVRRRLKDLGLGSAWIESATEAVFEQNARRLYRL